MFSHPLRLLALAGLLATTPLFAYNDEKDTAPTLTDAEIRTYLNKEELTLWDKTTKLRDAATRDLAKAVDLAKPARSITLKGFETESAEQRKTKADAMEKDAKDRLAATDKTFGDLRTVVRERMKDSVVAVECPVLALPAALKAASAEIMASASAVNDRLAIAGVFLNTRGTLASDAGLTSALREALTAENAGMPIDPAPTFVNGALKLGSDKTGVVVAEVYPIPAYNGALLSIRLIEGRTFAVKAATLAIIPSDKASGSERNSYDRAPTAYRAVFTDKNNFLGRLGSASQWSFGVDGSGYGAALLRAAIFARRTPLLNDYAFLSTALGGTSPDKISRALWTTETAVGTARFNIGSRAAAGKAPAVPVGELTLGPAPTKNAY